LAKPEWGTKRICHDCGTRFYDLLRGPVICPSCGAKLEPEALLKTRRSRVVTGEREEPVKQVRAPSKVEAVREKPAEKSDGQNRKIANEDEAAKGEEVEKEEKVALIEDASELGEDEDDMAEVIDQVDPEEDR
jgi:uncharacterized protein (TIGR02300 family)